jgi:SAM-dependent methyltransferase
MGIISIESLRQKAIDCRQEIIKNDKRTSNYQKHTNKNPFQKWLIRRFHQTAAELAFKTDITLVLDAGCGEGFAMRDIFSGFSGRVVGADLNGAAVSVARESNIHHFFLRSDVTKLPFPEDTFDLVMSLEVLEHISHPEACLRELIRVSRKWLLLSVPHEPFFSGANILRIKNLRHFGNDPGHVNHWSARAFARFLKPHCRLINSRLSFPWVLTLCQKMPPVT